MHTQPRQHPNHSIWCLMRTKARETSVSKAVPIHAPIWHLADADPDLRACTPQPLLPPRVQEIPQTQLAPCTGKAEAHDAVEKQLSEHQLEEYTLLQLKAAHVGTGNINSYNQEVPWGVSAEFAQLWEQIPGAESKQGGGRGGRRGVTAAVTYLLRGRLSPRRGGSSGREHSLLEVAFKQPARGCFKK